MDLTLCMPFIAAGSTIAHMRMNQVMMNNHNKQWRRSYANIVQTYLSRNRKPPDVQDPNDDEIGNSNTVKPIFLQDQDIVGSVKVTKPMCNCATNLHHLTSLL
jgi:hypothetical protein